MCTLIEILYRDVKKGQKEKIRKDIREDRDE